LGESGAFTGKERDEETGLYYYGARYLDSRSVMWISTDPALGEYVPGAPVNDEARKRNKNLPGMGGVYNTVNLHLYHYAGNNPVKYTDPDGKELYQPLIFKQMDTAFKAVKFLIENRESILKIGIGAGKIAVGAGLAALGTGTGAGITVGSGGVAALGGVALADAAIVAGGAFVGVGAADVLDGISMLSQGNDSSQIQPERMNNPKHHAGSSSPQPDNTQELFDKSIPDGTGVRWAKDDNGIIHRFSRPSNGQSHWNGSTGGNRPIRIDDIPIEIRRVLE
jgi:hypothetical protein